MTMVVLSKNKACPAAIGAAGGMKVSLFCCFFYVDFLLIRLIFPQIVNAGAAVHNSLPIEPMNT